MLARILAPSVLYDILICTYITSQVYMCWLQAAFSAARHGREDELEKLLESVHVNLQNEAGNTLLIVAAQVR